MKERGFEHLSGNLPKLSLRKQAMHNALAIAALVAIVSLLVTSRFVFAQDEAEAGNKVYMPIIANQGESASAPQDGRTLLNCPGNLIVNPGFENGIGLIPLIEVDRPVERVDGGLDRVADVVESVDLWWHTEPCRTSVCTARLRGIKW